MLRPVTFCLFAIFHLFVLGWVRVTVCVFENLAADDLTKWLKMALKHAKKLVRKFQTKRGIMINNYAYLELFAAVVGLGEVLDEQVVELLGEEGSS